MVDITFSRDPHELCASSNQEQLKKKKSPGIGTQKEDLAGQKPKPHEARMNQGRPEFIRSGSDTALVLNEIG